ncbi:MAG: UDP-4-amino-4,6-dideoxy-N-acetyl-beta-L-altrosamine N-acetyltransferase [Alphaproteobacteria bacterium]|nr:UDP-4-amino-4,6-dideoxy-N-acetyl-beta-L-altrosamine N-acetyltransferase [Alphaproteobacteria bacterium]
MTVDIKRRPRKIELVALTDVSTEIQLKLRDLRNEDTVRKWMFTDRIIGLNEHLIWLSRIKTDDSQMVFVVLDENHCPVGMASVNTINYPHRKADWAFYLTGSAVGGLGAALEFAFINFIFDSLDIEKLNCQVIEGNDAVVKLHRKFLFETEGFRRSHIINNGRRAGVHLLGLVKKDWMAGRDEVFKKYRRIFDKYSVAIKWGDASRSGEKQLIDQIEMARAKNNLNWMNILRLVLELSPEHGKALITNIRDIDREISELSDKLVSE